MTSYRQWWQTNVDVTQLESLYDKTKRNVTWNPAYSYGQGSTKPIYWDNPYWSRFENYQTDTRDRVYGNATATYQFTDKFSVMGRLTLDQYSLLREERRAVGSVPTPFGVPGGGDQSSGYFNSNRRFMETNVDVIATYNTDLGSDFNLNVMGGFNYRHNKTTEVNGSTNGGLIVPGLYSLTNAPDRVVSEFESEVGVQGFYGAATLGYKSFLYFDFSARNDWSSTLSPSNNSYFYPAVSGSFVFSELMDSKAVSFGKLRLNWAQVGKGASWGVAGSTPYNIPIAFTSPLASSGRAAFNEDLKPERTNSIEAGLEMFFYNRRVGFDVAYYKTNSIDQIVSVPVSYATGYSSKWLNAGEIENQGFEISLMATAVKKENFTWDIMLNWSKNTNKVISLADGIDNLQLGSFQGGVTVNARVGEAYGAITGSDYVYEDGKKVVGPGGYYEISQSNDKIIGNITPDFNAGLTNTFGYKQWSMSFLLDWQKGGDLFSLDQWYGRGTGLYEESAGNNDLGNPKRDPVVQNPDGSYASNSGGTVLEGVMEDPNNAGSYIDNTTRINGDDYAADGWATNPNGGFIYDASYLKLRSLSITYRFPSSILEKTFISNASLSFVGSNLWIIYKNLPYADPEAGLSSGNVQGFQSGVLPTTRNFGFNLKLNF